MRDIENAVTGRYLAAKMREWLRKNPKKSQADFAKAAGLSGAQISLLLSSGRGAGRKTLRNVARVLGTTPDAIETEAVAWAKDHACELFFLAGPVNGS